MQKNDDNDMSQRFFIGYFSFMYYMILQHFAVVIKLFIKLL